MLSATFGRRVLASSTKNVRAFLSTSGDIPQNSSRRNELPAESDVVIIGGGSIGCQTLYHLCKLGLTNVTLLERDKLTSGTTWHTAGLLWRLRPDDVDIRVIARSLEVFKCLEEETSVDPGWMGNGGLFIANNKERLDEYKRLYSVGKAFGIESQVLSPRESKELYPLLNVDDVYGTLYSPLDGTITPEVCTGLARAAKRSGAKVVEECSVLGLDVQDGKIVGVETNLGRIKSNAVVNCAGAWGGKVAKMAGVEIPLVAMKHAYITTERMEGIAGMPNVRDHDASVYLKVQGDALHIGGYEKDPIFWDDIKDDFSFGLFDLDWSVFSAHIEGAVNRVPLVGETGVKSTVCGPESFTPDHKPIMGEDTKVRGLYHGCGFNSAGLMLGGGCGEQLAYWIRDGRPEIDMYSYDIRRFCPTLTSNRDWVRQRSHESYAKNYSMVFPHDEPLAGRNQKKSAVHQVLADQGCVYQERMGWERPGWFSVSGPCVPQPYDWYGAYGNESEDNAYGDRLQLDYTFEHPRQHANIRYESLSARYGAALFDMSYFGKFYIGGEGAQKAVDWIFSNDLSVPAGRTVYTCMLNKKAGLEADLTVSITQDEGASEGAVNPLPGERSFYIAASGGSSRHSLTHIKQALQDADLMTPGLKLLNLSSELGLLSLQGPDSRCILEKVSPEQDWSDQAFPPNTHKLVQVAGHTVRALRVSFVGELGWELHCPNDACVPVYSAIMNNGITRVTNAGYRAMDSLSAEKGYPHWHADIRTEDNPLEAGLMFACKLKSDVDFLGRKALEEIKQRGAKKKKVCFTIDDEKYKDVCLLGLESVFRNGQPVGVLRRGEYAFYLDKPIAFGYVSHPEGDPVTAAWLRSGDYEVESLGRRIPVSAHLKGTPFDPKGQRIKGNYDSKELEGARKKLESIRGKLEL